MGIGRRIPEIWRGYSWSGCGTPDAALVTRLLLDMGSGGVLPTTGLLKSWPALEASALRAMDLLCVKRLVAILHADDPVFLSSSWGATQGCLNHLSIWAREHGAEFHVGKEKTIVMPAFTGCVQYLEAGPVKLSLPGASAEEAAHKLEYALQHKWLGSLWSWDLHHVACLRQRLAMANHEFSNLDALVAARALPLQVAVQLFEAKVDSVVAYARWMHAILPEAADTYMQQYGKWALRLLGAPLWRSGVAACSELGWHLNGQARSVRDVALRRAQLLRWGEADLYRASFEANTNVPGSWASKSKGLLQEWGVERYEVWSATGGEYGQYKQYVDRELAEKTKQSMVAGLQVSSAILPYMCIQMPVSTVLAQCREAGLDWATCLAVRSWCRLRADYIELAGRSGHRSSARDKSCIFCEGPARNPAVHVLGKCGSWTEARTAFLSATGLSSSSTPEEVALAVLKARPSERGFTAAVVFAREVDDKANE